MKTHKLLSVIMLAVALISSLYAVLSGSGPYVKVFFLPDVQISELAKYASIMFVSAYFSDRGDAIREKPVTVLFPFLITVLFSVLIFILGDYSGALVYLLVMLALMAVAGAPILWLVLFLFFAFSVGALWMLSDSERVRILAAFFVRNADPELFNREIITARAALSAGGAMGTGLGNGIFKLGRIADIKGDFIIASIAEELGLIGILIVYVLFTIYGVAGFKSARLTARIDPFESLASFGLTFAFVLQACMHVMVILGWSIPSPTYLPFFSDGGMNLFMLLTYSGIIAKAFRNRVPKAKDDEPDLAQRWESFG